MEISQIAHSLKNKNTKFAEKQYVYFEIILLPAQRSALTK